MSSNFPNNPRDQQLARAETVYRRLVKLLADALRKLRRGLRRLRRVFALEFLFPGVYIEEVPTNVHTIPGVPTSITGILCEHLAFVEFRFREAAPQQLQAGTDTCCSVEVSCRGFTGRVKSVWFARDDIKRFLSELEEFAATRKGSVRLLNQSSSSDTSPLTFELVSVDGAGHLIVRAGLLKTRHRNDELDPIRVSVSFAVDAVMLRSMVLDFRQLFAFRQKGT